MTACELYRSFEAVSEAARTGQLPVKILPLILPSSSAPHFVYQVFNALAALALGALIPGPVIGNSPGLFGRRCSRIAWVRRVVNRQAPHTAEIHVESAMRKG